jgi:adenosine deaminase CECR1
MEYLSKVLIKKEEYEKEEGVELPFVLHGGESLNLSTESLFDLILLKTKRIGHGLNLIKVRKQNIFIFNYYSIHI